jgi:hypothetical protein
MRNNDIPLDIMISQEMVPDAYVFGSRMLTRVVTNLDGTHCHMGGKLGS